MCKKNILSVIVHYLKCLLLSAGFLLLVGCSLTQPVKTPPVATYVFGGYATKFAQRKHVAATLLVSEPLANAGYESTNMVYMDKLYQLKSFSLNRWIAPPAQMLLPILVESLKETRYFKAVVGAPSVGVFNYRLDTRILKLQQEFLQSPSCLRFALEVVLVDLSTQKIVASTHFESSIKVQSDTPYGGVLATNQAISSVMDKLVGFVPKSVG